MGIARRGWLSAAHFLRQRRQPAPCESVNAAERGRPARFTERNAGARLHAIPHGDRFQVLRLILREGLVLASIGLGLGLLGSILVGRRQRDDSIDGGSAARRESCQEHLPCYRPLPEIKIVGSKGSSDRAACESGECRRGRWEHEDETRHERGNRLPRGWD